MKMKHLQITTKGYPLLMIRSGNKVNIISDGEIGHDYQYITFDTIKIGDSRQVFNFDKVITSRTTEGKYPNCKNPIITEIEISKSEHKYHELFN